jgi:hypothetical protein
MAGMNWDRARRDALMARSTDYTNRADAAELRLVDRPGHAARKGHKKGGSKAERRRRAAAALGISEASCSAGARRRHLRADCSPLKLGGSASR